VRKKIISMALVLLLCFSLTAPVLAEAGRVKQFSSYVSLGDSIACGYNAENLEARENMYWKVNDMAYCWQVADAVGCARENVYAEGASFCGSRTVEMYMLLGGQAERDGFNCDGSFFGARLDNMLENYADAAQQKVSEAGLITINIGGNDITNYPLHVTGLLDGEGREFDAKLVGELVAYIWDGYHKLCTYYPLMLERIRELNSHATVLVTGIFNPAYGAELSEEFPVSVTSLLSLLTGLINEKIEKWAEDANAVYVDVDDAESYFNVLDGEASTVLGGIDNMLLFVHPTEEGYKYMARQMIAALSETATDPLSTKVRIDLNGINAMGITSVTVDGRPADYIIDGDYYIVVDCGKYTASRVKVTAQNGEKIQSSTWSVDWERDTGYTSSLTTRTGDTAQNTADFKTVCTKLISVMKSFVGKIFGR